MISAASPNRPLAPALLFVGCHSSTNDRLYGSELDAWVKAGVVDVRYAFSKEEGKSEGCKYVQDRMTRDREDVVEMWERGARVYVCGGREFVAGIGKAARGIVREQAERKGLVVEGDKLEEWFKERLANRCATDVFS